MSNIIKCLVVDDEPLAVELIIEHASKMNILEIIGYTHNPIEALQILKEDKVDLLFLDIQMPILTGLELARTLKDPPAIIFTTAYRDYAVESYELDVVDYLVKPITFTRFIKAINKYLERSTTTDELKESGSSQSQNYIFVNANKKHHKIYHADILYVESLKEYVRIFTKETSIMTKSSMGDFENLLPNSFLRVHRSYIVNLDHVSAYTAHDVEIGNKEIPIGGSYKKEVQSIFNK